jgi:diguanylate cyclase (GGDEF)-like protein
MKTCRGEELAIKECVALQKDLEKVETPGGFACAACIDLAFERATTDQLTGLYNRYGLTEKFEKLTKEDTPFLVMMADIENHKQVNDRLGYSRGDKLLVDTGQFLIDSTRREDVVTHPGRTTNGQVGRWGGDEFVMLMPLIERRSTELSSDERVHIITARTKSNFASHPTVVEINQELQSLGQDSGGGEVGLHLKSMVWNGESFEETLQAIDPKGPSRS